MTVDTEQQGATDYVRATSIDEAVAALASTEGARPLAGGTDLMVQLRLGARQAPLVVDLTGVEALGRLDEDRIGAAVTVRRLLQDPGVAAGLPALIEAARLLGGRQIQAMATLGGNLCNASPAAELATPLLVHDAHAEIAGPDGVRTVPLEQLWAGPGRTILEPGELLTGVEVRRGGGRSAYRRIELRRSVDIAVVSVAARLEVVDDRVVQARVALGAAAPTPLRVPDAEAALTGARVGDEVDAAIEQASRLARTAAVPIDDTRATANYRAAMVEVLAARALRACVPT